MNPFPPDLRARWISVASIGVIAVSVIAYLPAVGNSFISDDFTMLPFVRLLSAHPGQILEMPSEIFRAVSYVYFWLCLQLFGAVPESFYWTGIALHAFISLGVGKLAWVVTRSAHAGVAAALFFAAYERHQEAVMWISAVNDALLTLFCVLFLLFWERAVSEPGREWNYRIALGMLSIAMFSKEAVVAMIPLALLLMILRDRPWREIAWKGLPLLLMLTGYIVLWFGQLERNFFIVDGHYALGFHFFPVYWKSFVRILSPSILFLIPLGIRRTLQLLRNRSLVFFVLLVALTIVPYSFLTYLDHIPSRNTYLPSVGLAGLVGILFAALYRQMETWRGRTVCFSFLAVVVLGNVGYIRLKKQPQFEERAAPTRELIARLNSPAFRDVGATPIYVCGFPLHVSIGRTAVEGFTRFEAGRIAFLERCEGRMMVNALEWMPESETYVTGIATAESEAVPGDSGEDKKRGGL
jgi:hypothetical protein